MFQLTRQQQKALAAAVLLFFTGLVVKAWRAAQPVSTPLATPAR